MSPLFRSTPLLLALAALIGVAAALATTLALLTLAPTLGGSAAVAQSASTQPGMDYVDRFVCPRGMTRIAFIGGVEDGFSRQGDEPSRIASQLLGNGYFDDLAKDTNNAYRLRAYDEGGVDKVLLEHFEVPTAITSGELVLRIKPEAGHGNDGIKMGDLDETVSPGADSSLPIFESLKLGSATDEQALSDGSVLLHLPLNTLAPVSPGAAPQSLLGYLDRPDRSPEFSVQVGDDTAVDFMALLLCQRPIVAKGATFSEHRNKVLGPDISSLGCISDLTQHGCDPFAGDHVCTTALPLACYIEGNRPAPPGLEAKRVRPTTFVGGEVRLTEPLAAAQFARLADADKACAARFGAEWRVLSYHEGGGGNVLSFSKIAPRSRAWINIRDQQYGNCWDRNVPR